MKGLIVLVGWVFFAGEKGFCVWGLEEDAMGRSLGSITADEASDTIGRLGLARGRGDGVRGGGST